MADSNRNNLRKSRIEEDRNQRKQMPDQPGAFDGEEEQPATPEEARDRAEHRLGKTGRHTSDDRERPDR